MPVALLIPSRRPAGEFLRVGENFGVNVEDFVKGMTDARLHKMQPAPLGGAFAIEHIKNSGLFQGRKGCFNSRCQLCGAHDCLSVP